MLVCLEVICAWLVMRTGACKAHALQPAARILDHPTTRHWPDTEMGDALQPNRYLTTQHTGTRLLLNA